jgi:hypothetical protein
MEFNDLDEIYSHLEEAAFSFEYAISIGDLFKNIRDKFTNDGEIEEAIVAQWELEFFHFNIKEGKCSPMFEGPQQNGESYKWPTFVSYTDWTYAYLKRRLRSTKNPLLISRYSHILWCSPKRHSFFAKQAIDAYVEVVKLWKEVDEDAPDDHYGVKVGDAIENAYFLSSKINYRKNDLKNALRDLVFNFNWQSSSFYSLRSRLIRLMLKERKNFKGNDFLGVDNLCDRVARQLIDSGNHLAAIDMYSQAFTISTRLIKQNLQWLNKIASCYEQMCLQSQAKDNLVCVTYCQSALEYYKKAKNDQKTKELSRKYEKLKSSRRLPSISEEVDLSEHVDYIRRVVKKIVKRDSDDIIKVLMYDSNLLPRKSEMEKEYEKQKEKYVLQDMFPATIIDGQGHTVKHFVTDEEKKYWGILQNYNFYLQFTTKIMLKQIIMKSFQADKLNAEIILTYFQTYSWLGQVFEKETHSGEKYLFSWLSAIAPAVYEMFRCLQVGMLSGGKIGNLVLFIDSLTTKFEGLFREMCQLHGIETFRIKDDNLGRSVYMEKDLHALFMEDAAAQFINEDDLLFFKYLLVEQAGMSLRHSVAHGLVNSTNYSLNGALLLLLALLRVAKYQLVSK